jgi:hypothetical protein
MKKATPKKAKPAAPKAPRKPVPPKPKKPVPVKPKPQPERPQPLPDSETGYADKPVDAKTVRKIVTKTKRTR